METNTDLYEKNLWGKIDYLHERYHREHNHISNFLDMMSKFQNACIEFSKIITNVLNKNYILSESNTSTIYKSMENYYKLLSIHSQAFKDIFESIKINILPVTKSIYESFQKEKEMYNSYSKIRAIYNNNRINLDKMQKEFNQRGKECENLVYNAKKAKMFQTATHEQILKMEAKATEHLANTAVFEDKYVQALNETNKSRENEINSQKKLQNYYHNIDVDYYGKVKMMTGFFTSCLKRMYTSISTEIDALNEKYENISIEDDINEFIEKNKVETKPDEQIKFIPYKPAPEINGNSIFSSSSAIKENKDLEVSFEVIKVFQKLLRYIRKDLNMDEERKKNRLRILANKILRPGDNASFTDKEKTELFLFLKQPVYRNYYIIILSKQRTKGYQKSENLINDLCELFTYILDISEKEKDYDSALNCIILSQTYYCEVINQQNNKKEKRYLVDGIKHNKWLTSVEFWDGILELMIEREIKKNENINQNKDEKEKKGNLNNIVFSQLFSYSNNMVEFNINKKDIQFLVEKYSKKYDIGKELYESIIGNINNKEEKKEEIKEHEKIEKNIEVKKENNDKKEKNNVEVKNDEKNLIEEKKVDKVETESVDEEKLDESSRSEDVQENEDKNNEEKENENNEKKSNNDEDDKKEDTQEENN